MLEQIGNALPFVAHYTESKLGKTGLTVTVDVWKWNGSSWSSVITGASCSEIGRGGYSYQLGSGSVTEEGLYFAVFVTATTSVDLREIPSLWVVGKAGVDNLDAAVTSRLAPTTSGRTLDVSAGGEAGVDWSNVGGAGSTVALSGTTVKTATDVEADTQDLQAKLGNPAPASTIGADLLQVLDTVDPTNADVQALVQRLGSPTTTTPPNVDLATAVADLQSRVPAALVSGRIDASVGAMAAGTVTAAAVATGAIDADALATDAVTEIAAGIAIPSAATIADAVCDEALSGHTTAGTVGKALSYLDQAISSVASPTAAAIADAVCDEALSGHTTAGTVGGQLGLITADTVVQSGPVLDSGDLLIVKGDDYSVAGGNVISLSSASLAALSVSSVLWIFRSTVTGRSWSKAGTWVSATGTARLALSSAETAALRHGVRAYQVDAELTLSSPAGEKRTPWTRFATVVEGVN